MALNTGQLVSVDIEGAPASLAPGNRQDTCPVAKPSFVIAIFDFCLF